jgi:TolA-binding protein
MNRIAILAVLCGSSLCYQANAAAQPAPAEKGLADGGPEIAQADGQNAEEKTASSQTEVTKTPEQRIADLEAEIENLLSQVKILEGENTNLTARIKTLESAKDTLSARVATLEGDSASMQEELAKLPAQGGDGSKEQTTAKPAFTYAAVRFHNHEGKSLRMNVNGVWHTLKAGKNDIWVPHGPVHIFRYTSAEKGKASGGRKPPDFVDGREIDGW